MSTLRALTSFAVPGQRVIREGDLVDSSDPVVKGREALFVSSDIATSVEQATSAPGEKRTLRRTKAEPVADVEPDGD